MKNENSSTLISFIRSFRNSFLAGNMTKKEAYDRIKNCNPDVTFLNFCRIWRELQEQEETEYLEQIAEVEEVTYSEFFVPEEDIENIDEVKSSRTLYIRITSGDLLVFSNVDKFASASKMLCIKAESMEQLQKKQEETPAPKAFEEVTEFFYLLDKVTSDIFKEEETPAEEQPVEIDREAYYYEEQIRKAYEDIDPRDLE